MGIGQPLATSMPESRGLTCDLLLDLRVRLVHAVQRTQVRRHEKTGRLRHVDLDGSLLGKPLPQVRDSRGRQALQRLDGGGSLLFLQWAGEGDMITCWGTECHMMDAPREIQRDYGSAGRQKLGQGCSATLADGVLVWEGSLMRTDAHDHHVAGGGKDALGEGGKKEDKDKVTKTKAG